MARLTPLVCMVFLLITAATASAGKLQEIRSLNGNLVSDIDVGSVSSLTGEAGVNTLWAVSDNGLIEKVNINGTPLASLNVGGSLTHIVLFGVNTMWATNTNGTLHKINIDGTLLGNFDLGGSLNHIEEFGVNTIWLANGSGSIQEFNIISESVSSTIEVGGIPNALVGYGVNTLWIANGNGRVQEVDIFGTVIQEIEVGGTPTDIIGFGVNTLWVANANGSAQKVSTGGSVSENVTLTGPAVAIHSYGTSIWVATSNGFLQELSNQGQILNTYEVGGTPTDLEGYGVNTIWVSNGVNNVVQPPAFLLLDLDPTTLPFGTAIAGSGAGPLSVTIRNDSTVPITVASESSDPFAFSVSAPADPSLDIGQTTTVNVSFLSQMTPGSYSADIRFNYSDGGASSQQQLVSASATVVPLEPAACLSRETLNFGQVNAGTEDSESFTIESCGTENLLISSASIVPVQGNNIWSISPTVPPNINLAPGDTRTFTVTASVPPGLLVDTPYEAQLALTTTDANNPSRQVVLTATGHVPVARIDIPSAYWEIDFREVELGFTFSRPLVIRNTGDLDLEFSANLVDPTDVDISNFDLQTSTGGTFTGAQHVVPPGSEHIFKMSFAPLSNGQKAMAIRIENSNDPTFMGQNILLTGLGTPPTPVDAVLILDRSGSMNNSAGELSKIAALRRSADIFLSLLRRGTDFVGLTQYNHESQNIVTLDLIDDNEQAASDTITGLVPDGATGIGTALRTASQQYASSPAEASPPHKKVMVVLTDGLENRTPYIQEVLDGSDNNPGLFSEHPDLLMYAVGLGNAITINVDRLQAMTNRGEGGFFHLTGNLSGLGIYDLENFYFKVFADAVGQVMVVDPTFAVLPAQTLEVPVGVISEDREALFFFIGDLPEDAYIFELIDPTGQVITSTAMIGGMSVQVQRHDNWSWFRVKFPELTMSSTHVGTWRFRVRIESPEKWVRGARGESYSGTYDQSGMHRMSVAASVKSNYRMAASVRPESVLTGEPLNLNAEITNGGWPSPDATVAVTITRPDGSVDQAVLIDRGASGTQADADGVFSNDYLDTDLRGVYQLLFQSDGITDRGETVTRQVLLSKFVGMPTGDPVEGECVSCRLAKGLVWIGIILLLMILWSVRRRYN